MKILPLLARLILAAVFIGAAIPKILDPPGFALAVFRYQILPDSLINLAALFLPWLELVAALALLGVRRLRDSATLIIAGLLAIFTLAIALNLYRGIDVACGCFTVKAGARHMGALNLLRNLGLLVLCALPYIPWKKRPNHLLTRS